MLIQRFSPATEITNVDKTGLALVVAACDQLAKGSVSFGELWPGDTPDFPTILHDRKALERAQADFWRLKRAAAIMNTLRLSLETKLCRMGRAVGPASKRSGLQHLPQDVLREVVAAYERMVTEDLDSQTNLSDDSLNEHFKARECIRKLALVNRQFRDAVYELSQCFADVGFERPTEKGAVERSLRRIARCKTPAFNMLLREDEEVIKIKTRYIFNQTRSLCFLHHSQEPCNFFGTKTLELPKLAKMRLQFSNHSTEYEIAFLSSISTPYLKALRLTTLDAAYPEILSSVTSLDVAPRIYAESIVVMLFEALLAIPALQRLTLRFGLDLKTTNDTLIFPSEVKLPNLESFALLIDSCHGRSVPARNLLRQIFGAIKIPLVTDLVVDATKWLHYKKWSDHHKSINDFSMALFSRFFTQELRRLRTLRLMLLTSYGNDEEGYAMSWVNDVLPAFLKICPTVRSFEFSFPTAKLYNGIDLLAKLDHLTIYSHDCKSSDMEDLLVSILTQDELTLTSINISEHGSNGNDELDSMYWKKKLERRMPDGINLQLF